MRKARLRNVKIPCSFTHLSKNIMEKHVFLSSSTKFVLRRWAERWIFRFCDVRSHVRGAGLHRYPRNEGETKGRCKSHKGQRCHSMRARGTEAWPSLPAIGGLPPKLSSLRWETQNFIFWNGKQGRLSGFKPRQKLAMSLENYEFRK